MIIFYYYKEDTCTLNWNNIVFFQQHYRGLHVYNDSMIQKHMSRVSSSLKNREKVKIKPYGIELSTGKHYVHVTRLSILSSLLQGDSFKCLTWYIQCMYINVYYSNSSVVANKYEPQHDKSNKMMCAQRRLRSAWTSAQSDQSIHCMEKHWFLSYPVSVQLIWVFARSHAGRFIGFVMLWFIYIFQF